MLLKRKRHIVILALAYAAGIILWAGPIYLKVIALILLSLGNSVWLRKIISPRKLSDNKQIKIMFALVCVFVALGITISACQSVSYKRTQGSIPDGKVVKISGTVSAKSPKEDSYVYRITKTEYGIVNVYCEKDDIPIGSRVTVSGEIRLFPHARNQGNFDTADYYRTQNISAAMYEAGIKAFAKGDFREALYKLQKKIYQVYDNCLNSHDAGLLQTIALGNRSGLDDDTQDLYRENGISHILCISGLHISLLGYGLFSFMKKAGAHVRVAAVCSSLIVILFALMTGFGVSSKRAIVMFLIMMGATVLGRTYDGINAIALSSLIILLQNPYQIFTSGFIYSYMAIAGITMVVPIFDKPVMDLNQKIIDYGISRKNVYRKEYELIEKLKKRALKLFIGTIRTFVSGLVIQLVLIPITAWNYYEVPVYTFLLNPLVLGLVSILLAFALLGGFTGLFCIPIAKWIFVVCHYILKIYDWAMERISHWPGNVLVTGRPSVAVMVVYYGIFSFLMFLIITKLLKQNQIKIISLVMAAALIFTVFIRFPHSFEVDYLDVGQGDGICIDTGRGEAVFIDGGSSSVNELAKYRILPYLKCRGISHIDQWIVTHPDDDHVLGLMEALESGYRIDNILLVEGFYAENYEKIISLCKANGTNVRYVKAGDEILFDKSGKSSEDSSYMKLIYPENETDLDDNDMSQIWFLKKNGFSFLFTGDIGSEVEDNVKTLLKEIDVLKVAHHGSKYSSSEEFLDVTSPRLAIISCGENNLYGHPHRETVKRLEDIGANIYRTDERGEISVIIKGNKLKCRYYLK